MGPKIYTVDAAAERRIAKALEDGVSVFACEERFKLPRRAVLRIAQAYGVDTAYSYKRSHARPGPKRVESPMLSVDACLYGLSFGRTGMPPGCCHGIWIGLVRRREAERHGVK